MQDSQRFAGLDPASRALDALGDFGLRRHHESPQSWWMRVDRTRVQVRGYLPVLMPYAVAAGRHRRPPLSAAAIARLIGVSRTTLYKPPPAPRRDLDQVPAQREREDSLEYYRRLRGLWKACADAEPFVTLGVVEDVDLDQTQLAAQLGISVPWLAGMLGVARKALRHHEDQQRE